MTTNHHCQAGGKKHSTKKKSRHVKNKTKSKKKTFRKTRKSMKGGGTQRSRSGDGSEVLLMLLAPAAPVLIPAGLATAALGYGGYRLGKAAYKWRMGRLDKKGRTALVNELKKVQTKAKSLSSKSVVKAFNEWKMTDIPEEHKKDVEFLLEKLLKSPNSSNSSNFKSQNKTNKNKTLHK